MSPRFFTPALLLRKSDAELATLVREGHEAAFSAIVLRHRSFLLRHCRHMLRDHRAEDAVQQTFVRALQALRSGTEVRELRPWLCRISRNVALDEIGARHGNHVELDEGWEDHGRSGEVERRAQLRDTLLAVEALPERQRTVLLRAVAGDSPGVIAHELGVTSMAARQLLHRARSNVRAAVQAISPPPLIWLARRLAGVSERIPRAAGAPAGAAPLATKIAVVVVASAGVAAPAAVIHNALTHHGSRRHPRPPAVAHVAPGHALAPILAAVPPPSAIVMQPVAHKPAPAPGTPKPAAAAKPRPSSAPAPAAPQSTGVSAYSPNSAPVGDGSGSPSTSSAGAMAANAGPSGAGSSGSSAAGPMTTASASGPTAAPADASSSPGTPASGSGGSSTSSSSSAG